MLYSDSRPWTKTRVAWWITQSFAKFYRWIQHLSVRGPSVYTTTTRQDRSTRERFERVAVTKLIFVPCIYFVLFESVAGRTYCVHWILHFFFLPIESCTYIFVTIFGFCSLTFFLRFFFAVPHRCLQLHWCRERGQA